MRMLLSLANGRGSWVQVVGVCVGVGVRISNLKQASDFRRLLVLCSSAIEKHSCLMGSRAGEQGSPMWHGFVSALGP